MKKNVYTQNKGLEKYNIVEQQSFRLKFERKEAGGCAARGGKKRKKTGDEVEEEEGKKLQTAILSRRRLSRITLYFRIFVFPFSLLFFSLFLS